MAFRSCPIEIMKLHQQLFIYLFAPLYVHTHNPVSSKFSYFYSLYRHCNSYCSSHHTAIFTCRNTGQMQKSWDHTGNSYFFYVIIKEFGSVKTTIPNLRDFFTREMNSWDWPNSLTIFAKLNTQRQTQHVAFNNTQLLACILLCG